MSSILVVEGESRYVERIQDALASEGWSVQVAHGREEAMRLATAKAPRLAIVASDVEGAADLLGAFSHRNHGPGSLLLIPEGGTAPPKQAAAADEILEKPFTDQALRLATRRLLTRPAGSNPAPAAASGGVQLTSADIFGDMLAEVEGGPAAPAPRTVVPPPAQPAPPPRPTPSSPDMERKLEETLSGVLGATPKPAPKPAAPPRPASGGDVDQMLSRTLSGLDMPKRPAAAQPAKPAAAPPSAAAATPAAAPPPAVDRTRSGTKANDLGAQLDELTGVRRKPTATPPAAAPPADGIFTTQRIAVPPPAAPAPSPAPPKAAAPAAPPPAKPVPPPAAAAPAKPGPAAAKPAPAPAPTPAPARVEPPREFGQYALLERIALGGMAEVWKARMKGVEGFQKTVAIKKILAHLTDSIDFVTMFIDEAKLAAQLNHNNIIHIYDLGKIGEDYYIAMEYVEGKDLRSILNSARHADQPMPLGLALLVAARLASALDYAHRKRDFDNRELGLVHRDVSPQNVLISYEGDIKLCDFGIVKAVAKASKTQMGALKGKLQYMSPEQAWGRSVDARSDIFSLGSVLFEMLTGRRLFAGDSEISVLEAVRECRIQNPGEIVPSLPADVRALVMRALARDADDRFQNAGEMQKELERVLYGMRPTPGQDELAGYMRRLYGVEAAAAPRVEPTASRTPEQAKPAREEKGRGAAAAAPVVEAVPPASPTDLREAEEGEKKNRLPLIAAVIAAVLILGAWLLMRGKGEEKPAGAETTSADAAVVPAAATGAASTAATPTSGPDYEKLVAEEVRKREEALKKKFDDEQRALQAELAKSATSEEAKKKAQAELEAKQKAEAERVAREQAESDRLAREKAEADRAAQEQAAAAETARQEAERLAAEQQQAAAATAAAAAAVPAAPTVQEGDLVTGGPGVTPPVLVSIDKPEYPPIARRMKVEGTVILSLLVDENGNVTESKIVSGVAQKVGINEAAQAAGRSARFRPATKGGVRVKMWYKLNLPFKL